MRSIWLIVSLFLFCCSGNIGMHTKKPGKKVSIPFQFGFNNVYFPSDSTLVQLFNSNDSLVFQNEGYKPVWGFRPKGSLSLTGEYTVRVTYFVDSLMRKSYQDTFSIDGSEQQIDLAINILRSNSNEVHVTKYFDNKFNVKLNRLWDPQEQFSSKKDLLPNYEWTNTYDSTIFGIYRRMSMSMMISWVQNWDIAYMRFQKYTDSGWVYLHCNAPRMYAELKKDSTAGTLTDMVLSCPAKEFQKGSRYRVLIEYGINDVILRKTKQGAGVDSSLYYEPHIYRVADEFILK